MIGLVVGASAARDRVLAERAEEHAERDLLTDLFDERAFERPWPTGSRSAATSP